MNTLSILCALLGVISLFSIHATAAENDCFEQAPLPNHMRISPLPSDVPDEIAKFSGIWGNGKWNDKLCNTLAVVSVDAVGNAEVIYSWGTSVAWGVTTAGYSRYKGKITHGTLVLENFRNDAEVTYWVDGDHLMGRYFRKNIYHTILSKIP